MVTAYTIYIILNNICSCTHLFYFQIWIRWNHCSAWEINSFTR